MPTALRLGGPVPIFFCGGGRALGLRALARGGPRGAAIAWPWTRVNPGRCNLHCNPAGESSGECQLEVVSKG